MRGLAFLLVLIWGGAAPAQTPLPPADAARAAQQMLDGAAASLEVARGGRDRVAALTETVQAYEAGLAALRDGMRAVARREDSLARDLAARDAEIGRLLGVLQSVSRAPAPLRLVHPEGPAGTVRAGMLISDLTPALQDEASRLRADLQEVRDLQASQGAAAERLREGLAGAQAARTALSQAVADRVALPRRFVEDPIQTAVLIAATDSLDGFAEALSMIATGEDRAPLPSIAQSKGALALPVAGSVLRAAGAADAAGVVRPGLLVATAPQALVTTPVPATVRYAGPLLNYGLVTILEPQADTLFVLAGMGEVFGATGEVLPAGDPVGLMPAASGPASQMSDGGGNTRPETLYIEVRENGRTVDPESWFNTGRE